MNKNTFAQIYVSLLVTLLVVLVSIALLTAAVNYVRVTYYTQSMLRGVTQLMAEGVARHSGVEQMQWIALASHLMGAKLDIVDRRAIALNTRRISQLQQQKFIILTSPFSSQVDIYFATDTPGRIIHLQLNDMAEQHATFSAFLILNDLGHLPAAQVKQRFETLQRYFPYEVTLMRPQKAQKLQSHDRDLLDAGRIVTKTTLSSVGKSASFYVYAPVREGLLLRLGPIALFQWYPLWLVMVAISLALVILASVSYLLIVRLQRKLDGISHTVTAIREGDISQRIAYPADDAIGGLAENINAMADHIESLLMQKKQLLEAVSHELKTPLARMHFRLEQLDGSEILTALYKDINELNHMVNEILDYSSIDYIETEKMPCNIANMLAELIEGFKEQTNITILHETGKTLADQQTIVYPDALRRAVRNILENAVNYATSQVWVRYEQEENNHRIIIADDGMGVPKEMRDKITQPFYRVDSSRNKNSGGHGLGLAIVERIVRLHSGALTISDQEKGGVIMTFSWKEIYNTVP